MRIDKNTTIRLGNRNIVKVKLGDVVIWQKTTGPVVEPDYFYIESLGDGNTISVINYVYGSTTNVTPTLEYSTDKNTWNTITFDWTRGEHTTELPVKLNTGGKMYFRNDTRKFSGSYDKYISFSSSVSSNVGGDIRTLSNYLDVDNETTVQSNMFRNLFSSNKYIVDASNLRLPYTTLADECYTNMFYGCTALTSTPTLPATTLASGCYYSMFQGCSKLTTAPALPATTMKSQCYQSMFRDCSKLTTAPALPATTLENQCYASMFQGCNSLTTAPTLPATTLAIYCYYYMFSGCSKLTSVPALPATTLTNYCYRGIFQNCSSLNSITVYANDISATECTTGWLSGVASTGTFNNYGSATYKANSVSGIPSGWTEVKPVVGPDYFYIESLGDGNTISVINVGNGSTGSETPTLEYSTDKNTWNTITFDWASGTHTTEIPVKLNTGGKMYFRNDTRLFSNSSSKYITFSSTVSSNVGGDIRTLSNYLDVNSETTPQSYMFYYLFYNNKKIVDASNLRLPYNTLASYCYNNMFNGCTSLTTAPELPATILASECYNSMFSGCSSLTTAPALPATTLVNSCYYSMFYGCTSLTTAPELPATKLEIYCYSSMFRGCSSLTTAPALPATTLAIYCCNQMFDGCTSLTTAPTELPATTLANQCYKSMFYRCTSLTTAPALPATTLVQECYYSMFYGCTKLKSVTVYAEDISASNCTNDWLSNVASSGTFNNIGFASFKTGSSGIPDGWTEVVPEIQSITANPDTFTIKSYKDTVKCTSTLTITTTLGTTVTKTNTAIVTVGKNTGDSTRTLTETIPYKSSSYQVTIVQTANDPTPTWSWNVVSTGTYPFELNTNGYYESTNKGKGSSYSYATLNYSGFDELVLECINSGESNYDYGIISQPDVQLSESTSDDGATGSTNVFKNFKGQSSTNPVRLTIPSDKGSHFITIKYRKDGSGDNGNDSLQFMVIEP